MISVQDISPSGELNQTGTTTNELLTTSSSPSSDRDPLTRTKLLNEAKTEDVPTQMNALASNQMETEYEELLSNKLLHALKTNNEGDRLTPSEITEIKPIKGKNAKKKRRQMKISQASTTVNQNQSYISGSSPGSASVQDFFQNYSSPTFQNQNPRYLENLTHHPQFQLRPRNVHHTMQAVSMQQNVQTGMAHNMQAAFLQQNVQSTGVQQQQTFQATTVQHARHSIGRQFSMQASPVQQSMQVAAIQQRQHPLSAPTTPLVMHQRPSTGSIPNSPNTGFFQNMMQHPLLNHAYVQSNFNTNVQSFNTPLKDTKETPTAKLTPNNKNKNNKKNLKNESTPTAEDKKFDAYMSAEDVEKGLKNNTLLEGILRINPKQFQHAYISTIDRDEQDVFIDGLRNRNRALEGDIVVVQLIEVITEENKTELTEEHKEESNHEQVINCTEKSETDQNDEVNEQGEASTVKQDKKEQKRGKVVFIKEKVHTRRCIGNLKLMPDKNRQRALFIPRDHRIPRLNIPFTSWPDNFYQDAKRYENTVFLAQILSWSDTRYAVGKLLSNIGQSGNMKTENLAILAENDLDISPYGPEMRDLFPRLDYTIPEEEIKKREDLRNLCIFSIDPSNCRDIDDAVSCKELSNGNYEIGVHISDVAHYLTENTILDEKVAQKATTIYLVERAYHMLPDELCMLCSLFPGVDKLAFSVFWEITKQGEVLSHRFAKTVINSCSQLAYEHAQEILDGKQYSESTFPETYNNFKYEDVRKSIEIIGGIAAIFRRNRFANGALRIDQPKIAFRLSPENGLPDEFSFYEIKASHQMIEEFMLLANMTVARRIYEDHPKLAFLRCHPPPSGYMLKNLAKALSPMGIELDISSAGALHRSLLPYTDPTTCDPGRAMVLNMLCAKPMTRAKYFCANACDDDDFLHYALNIPIYTHFTSPIRRYADIMVHRLLAASLQFRDDPQWEVDKVRLIAAQCNKQKYNAKKAGEMSSDLYMLKYIEMNSPIETEAVVVEVRDKFIDVILVAMNLNRRIYFNPDFPGEFNCIKHECGSNKMSKMEVTWREQDNLPEAKQVIEVFSNLKVHLHKADDMVKVETKLIRPQ